MILLHQSDEGHTVRTYYSCSHGSTVKEHRSKSWCPFTSCLSEIPAINIATFNLGKKSDVKLSRQICGGLLRLSIETNLFLQQLSLVAIKF